MHGVGSGGGAVIAALLALAVVLAALLALAMRGWLRCAAERDREARRARYWQDWARGCEPGPELMAEFHVTREQAAERLRDLNSRKW